MHMNARAALQLATRRLCRYFTRFLDSFNAAAMQPAYLFVHIIWRLLLPDLHTRATYMLWRVTIDHPEL